MSSPEPSVTLSTELRVVVLNKLIQILQDELPDPRTWDDVVGFLIIHAASTAEEFEKNHPLRDPGHIEEW